MKKKFILISLPIILLIALIFSSPLLTRNRTSAMASIIDLLNPLISNSDLYVKTTEKFEDTYSDTTNRQENYTYITTGFDTEGSSRKVRYTSFGKQLTPNRYLKLTTKGQNVRFFEEVQEEELPDKVRQQFD